MLTTDIVTAIQEHGFQDRLTSDILVWINAANGDIARAADWPWAQADAQVTLAASGIEGVGTLPAGYGRIVDVSLGGQQCAPLTNQNYRDKLASDVIGGDDGSDTTSSYTIWGASIHVYPFAGGAGTALDVWYIAQPAALTGSSGETPAIPERYHYLLVLGALRYAYRQDDETDQVQSAETDFQAGLEQMQTDFGQLVTDRPEITTVQVDGLTLGAMRQELRQHGYDYSDSLLNNLVNEGYQRFCNAQPWPFLLKEASLAATQGSAQFQFPDDCSQPTDVWLDPALYGVKLRPINYDALLDKFNISDTGMPCLYAMDNTVGSSAIPSALLYPIPDQAYTIYVRYVANLSALTDTNSVPSMPQRHVRAVLYGALAAAALLDHKSESRAADNAMYEQQFQARIDEARLELLQTQLDDTPKIERRAGDNFRGAYAWGGVY